MRDNAPNARLEREKGIQEIEMEVSWVVFFLVWMTGRFDEGICNDGRIDVMLKI